MTGQVYICRICCKPMELDDQTLMLMVHMNMPLDGGAYQSCLFNVPPINDKPGTVDVRGGDGKLAEESGK